MHGDKRPTSTTCVLRAVRITDRPTDRYVRTGTGIESVEMSRVNERVRQFRNGWKDGDISWAKENTQQEKGCKQVARFYCLHILYRSIETHQFELIVCSELC